MALKGKLNSPKNHLSILDRRQNLDVLDGLRVLQRVLRQHGEIRRLPDLDRPQVVLAKNLPGGVDGVGAKGLVRRDTLLRPQSTTSGCQPIDRAPDQWQRAHRGDGRVVVEGETDAAPRGRGTSPRGDRLRHRRGCGSGGLLMPAPGHGNRRIYLPPITLSKGIQGRSAGIGEGLLQRLSDPY